MTDSMTITESGGLPATRVAAFLVPEGLYRADGGSAAIPVGSSKGKAIILTLGITRIVEQESLDVQVWGSADGTEWGEKALLSFPQKYYCGTYSLLLDLSEAPEVEHLKATWKMSRWGRGEPQPQFGFYVFAQERAPLAAGSGL